MTERTVITLVTGGNRGMGLEISRELLQKGQHVIIGSRDLQKGQAALDLLAEEGLHAEVVQLDVTDSKSVAQAADTIKHQFGHLSVLVNNAGAVFDFGQKASNVKQTTLQQDFAINYFGLIDVTQTMLPLLQLAQPAKIVNVSSMMGSKTEALNPQSVVYNAVAVGYQSAKAAANMYTVQLAKEMQREHLDITVNAVDPGMVATEFGGSTPEHAKSMGARFITEGVARMVQLASDWTDQSTGTFTNTDGVVGW